MDVLILETAAPFRAPDGDGPPGLLRRWQARLARLLDPGQPGGGTPGGEAAAATGSLLLAYTAAEILLGLGLLVFVTVRVPIDAAIASTSLAGTALAGTTGGVLLWTMFGLMGSVRSISSASSPGHFTFNLPYVGAAMILGGPTAGAWVAFLSSIDRRELESQPWYGILANHAASVAAAVAGGTAYLLVREGLLGVTGDTGLSTFVAIIVAGVVLEAVANAFALATIRIRDGMSWGAVLGIIVDDFRRETILEVALIWVLVIASASVGWWAPLAVGILVIWYLTRDVTDDVDPLTGLMRKRAFLARADRKVGWMRRGILAGGTMLYLDLNGFHLVNNRYGHEVGDAALRVVAQRLRDVFPRSEDILSRLMGDELGVMLPGLVATRVAEHKAQELIDAIARPIPTPVGPVTVGVAVGIVVVHGNGTATPSAGTLFLRAEQAMYLAKERAPEGAWHLWSPEDPTPFGGAWLETPR